MRKGKDDVPKKGFVQDAIDKAVAKRRSQLVVVDATPAHVRKIIDEVLQEHLPGLAQRVATELLAKHLAAAPLQVEIPPPNVPELRCRVLGPAKSIQQVRGRAPAGNLKLETSNSLRVNLDDGRSVVVVLDDPKGLLAFARNIVEHLSAPSESRSHRRGIQP